MLCQFSFQNFKSYKKETVLDFQATAIPEFADSLLTSGKGGALLPVGVVYGPNGGGKTNLLQALSCLISTITGPVRNLGKNRQEIVVQRRVGPVPFLFDEISRELPTEFEIYFREGKNEYRYRLALLKNEVTSESLYWRAIGGKRTGTVFERTGSEIRLGPSIGKSGINRSVNPKMPYFSFLAINYDLPVIAEAQSWFEACIACSYADFTLESQALMSENGEAREQVICALNDMGIDVTGYRLDEEDHRFYTQRNLNGTIYELGYADESDGTKKLLAVLPVLLLALREGRLAIIDELDAKLHPKLLRYMISLFKNPHTNTKGAQLLFTSHDMATLKNSVFRRDEVWFAAANPGHESEIYSLYEIRREDHERVNNTAAYDKQYLEGRYGADPYLTNMLAGGDWK